MAFGWDDAGGAALQTGLKIGEGYVNQYFADRNRKANAAQSFKSYSKQAALDYQLASGPYFDLAQRYNEANYNLSRRYAENSAKWATTGLRKAGLNPILAASQGFNAQTGVQGAQISPSSSGSPSFNQSTAVRAPDILEGIRDMTSARLSEANASLLRKQEENVEAQTASTLVDTITKAMKEGLDGNVGGLVGALNWTLDSLTGSTEWKILGAVVDKATEKYVDQNVSSSASPDKKKAVATKARKFLSDIIKEEEAKRRKADFQNHYNHMIHGNGVMHMGH